MCSTAPRPRAIGSFTHLTTAMAEELDELGVTRVDEEGTPLYGGVRYLSRLRSHECWAVFNGHDYCASSAATSRNASLRRLVRAARFSGSRTNSAWGEGWNVLTTVRLRSRSIPGATRSSRRHA